MVSNMRQEETRRWRKEIGREGETVGERRSRGVKDKRWKHRGRKRERERESGRRNRKRERVVGERER